MIYYIAEEQQDCKKINDFLNTQAEKRNAHPTRQNLENFAIIFEPKECFWYHRPKCVESIRDKKLFDSYIKKNAVPIYHEHRGGGMIWNGPGQIILAPLVDLKRKKINMENYMDILEGACLQTLNYFGIPAKRNHYAKGAQGAWVSDTPHGKLKKIAFLGFYDKHGLAIEGCAINVHCDFHQFALIDPCDLKNANVTSMHIISDSTPSTLEVGTILAEKFSTLICEKYKWYSFDIKI